MFNLKKKDKVVVITGKNKKKRGEILNIIPDKNTAVVAKLNVVKKHVKPTQTDPGGTREIEMPIPISNLMLICPKCDQPTRPKRDFLSDEKKVRICRKCGEMIV
ncbi:MAG: 50S ribosomal protein L24 [Elusimicrobia bacterium RIFOXYA2_FULL_39_19]|nr:MAG: 50S ribosomal protein L24 [Elusimicrobia bacterium RIFOXYA2_FULL_39_19]